MSSPARPIAIPKPVENRPLVPNAWGRRMPTLTWASVPLSTVHRAYYCYY